MPQQLHTHFAVTALVAHSVRQVTRRVTKPDSLAVLASGVDSCTAKIVPADRVVAWSDQADEPEMDIRQRRSSAPTDGSSSNQVGSYEQQRLENIRRNEAILAGLGIGDAVETLRHQAVLNDRVTPDHGLRATKRARNSTRFALSSHGLLLSRC